MTETRNRPLKRQALAAVLCLVLLCFMPGSREACPEENKWYVFCEPRSGEVTYGEHLITGRKLMAGPFPGPKEASDWIAGNCPRWRCDTGGACAAAPRPGQGGEWKVFCGRNDLVVNIGKTYDPTRHILVQEGFLGEPDARAWVNQYYPGWLCTQTGAAASGPRMGGNWAVVCSKKHGGVSLTQYPNRIDYHVWGEGFLGEPDARAWTNRNCPSWRCDSEGRCLTGAAQRMPEGRPLEVPPDGPSTGSPPGPWGTPPGGGTIPPPSETKPPGQQGPAGGLPQEMRSHEGALREEELHADVLGMCPRSPGLLRLRDRRRNAGWEEPGARGLRKGCRRVLHELPQDLQRTAHREDTEVQCRGLRVCVPGQGRRGHQGLRRLKQVGVENKPVNAGIKKPPAE